MQGRKEVDGADRGGGGGGGEAGGVGSCRALSVSANSSALSNSMHVLMKHCWPAAHCQRHCYIDDWSIEGPCAFVRIQPSALPSPTAAATIPPTHPPPGCHPVLPRNLSRREPTSPSPLHRGFNETPKQRIRNQLHLAAFGDNQTLNVLPIIRPKLPHRTRNCSRAKPK